MASTLFTITGNSPATASTAVVGSAVNGLGRFDQLFIDAALVGATGGTLDVYLQRKITDNLWADWLHFAQLSAGAAAVKYALTVERAVSSIVTVGNSADASFTLALAAGAFAGGIPDTSVRCVAVAGSGTSVAAAVTIRIRGTQRAH